MKQLKVLKYFPKTARIMGRCNKNINTSRGPWRKNDAMIKAIIKEDPIEKRPLPRSCPLMGKLCEDRR